MGVVGNLVLPTTMDGQDKPTRTAPYYQARGNHVATQVPPDSGKFYLGLLPHDAPPHCGKNCFSLAKKRPSARVKLVGVGLARATSRASGTAYEKTASETTAIDALGGAKTLLYCPSGPVDN